jgi:hypothetical protein
MRKLWLCALFLAACASQKGSDPGPTQPTPVQPGITVSDDPNDFTKGNSYGLLTTTALYVRVVEPNLPATTMLGLTFTDPHGELFHEDHSPFTTNTDPTMMMDGLMHMPMKAWPADPLPGGWALIRSIPIAGTNFTRIPQPDGAWGLTADVDGVPGQLSTTVIFTH